MAHPTLISDHVGTNPIITSEIPALTFTSMIEHKYYHLWKGSTLTTTSMIGHNYYHLWKGSTLTTTRMIGHNYYHLWKGIALTSTSMIGHTYYHLWKGSSLTFDHVGTNPIVTSEWLPALGWGFLVIDHTTTFWPKIRRSSCRIFDTSLSHVRHFGFFWSVENLSSGKRHLINRRLSDT